MLNCIYDILLVHEKDIDANGAADDIISISLPAFYADARNNTRQYVGQETDIQYWHNNYDQLLSEEKRIREFISWHRPELFNAFKKRDRSAFDRRVKELEEEDAKAAEEANQ